MRVLLICQFAASSKLLVQRMREAAKSQGGEPIEVESEAITNLDAIQLDSWDVVLLAPQARHYLKKVRERTATDRCLAQQSPRGPRGERAQSGCRGGTA
ncbi:MAG: PTS sugar transporter subunit IIB [Bacillota bacterium]